MSHETMPIHESLGHDDKRRVVRRSHCMRTLGLGLGALMVGCVLYRNGAPVTVWVLWFLHGLAWPHIVRLGLRHSDRPFDDDERCYMVDAAMGGVWVALMQFNLLPCVALVTTYSMALIAIGGGKLLARGLGLITLTCAVTAVADGLAFAPATDLPELLATVPLLVLFPAALGIVVYRLTERVRRQNRQLLRMSSLDSLSGLLNRSYWEEAVNAAMLRRHSGTMAMLLIDIDHFKHVNDQHGHAAGDEVVRRLGTIIRSNLRENDLAGRYGGDEFGVLLDGADEAAAESVAERIRAGVACSLIDSLPGLHCTVSIGLAQGRADFRSAADWLKDADAALYRAKLAGRNRFVSAV